MFLDVAVREFFNATHAAYIFLSNDTYMFLIYGLPFHYPDHCWSGFI